MNDRVAFVSLLLLGLLLVAPTAGHAQQPDCPSSRTIMQAGGPLGNGSSVMISVTLKPCETATVTVTTSTQATYGASADAYFCNSAGREFFRYGWYIPGNSSTSNQFPFANGPAPNRQSFKGTARSPGAPVLGDQSSCRGQRHGAVHECVGNQVAIAIGGDVRLLARPHGPGQRGLEGVGRQGRQHALLLGEYGLDGRIAFAPGGRR